MIVKLHIIKVKGKEREDLRFEIPVLTTWPGKYGLRFKELKNKKAGKRNYRFALISSLKN